jgi:hypothetical protein
MSQESSDRHGTGRGLIDALMFVLFVLFTHVMSLIACI